MWLAITNIGSPLSSISPIVSVLWKCFLNRHARKMSKKYLNNIECLALIIVYQNKIRLRAIKKHICMKNSFAANALRYCSLAE